MGDHERLIELMRLLYASPGTSEGWQRFLDALRAEIRASGAAFVSYNRHVAKGDVTAMAGFAPEAVSRYVDHWAAEDPWARSSGILGLAPGGVAVGEEVVPRDHMVRTPYYNDYALHFDITHAMFGLLEGHPGALSILTLNRGERDGGFALDEQALLSALMPHLQRAVQMHRRLVGAVDFAAVAMDVLDRLPHCLLTVSDAGRVLFVNRRSRALLETRDGLAIDDGELRCGTVADTDALRAAMRAAASVAAGTSLAPSVPVQVGRPSGKRPYVVLVAPLGAALSPLGAAQSRTLLVTITDPQQAIFGDVGSEADGESREGEIRGLFNLSPAEARLAWLIVQGHTIREAAARLGWRESSARTRLKSVLEKTNTHRQAELIALVFRRLGRP
jgi:DNA-binding CsgD family transcriptional regulator